jgi:hypothetical protein
MLGGNIKIHFAAAEQVDFALIAYEAGIKYFLWTIFPFICGYFNINTYSITVDRLFSPRVLEKISNHTIMDSGLFSLMFGAHAGKRDKAFMEKYQEAFIDFVSVHKLKSSCVEIDCQKILGPEEAWRFRRRMRDKLPNRQINVLHYEDGPKGLDRLIEFSDYMGISVQEIHQKTGKDYKDRTYELVSYIKNKKPEIDIHLLGATDKSLLNRCRFCTSADSTSWMGVNRYGSLMGYAVRHIKKEALENAVPAIRKVLYHCHKEPTNIRLAYYGNYYIAAVLFKKTYERCAGGQD